MGLFSIHTPVIFCFRDAVTVINLVLQLVAICPDVKYRFTFPVDWPMKLAFSFQKIISKECSFV